MFVFAENNSASLTQTESMSDQTKNAEVTSELVKSVRNSTPRQTALIELISSEQRFVRDMKTILKVIHQTFSIDISFLFRLISHQCWKERSYHPLISMLCFSIGLV